MSLADIIQLIQLFALVLGGGFALFQYKKNQDFKRLQNLSSIWKQFADSKEMLELFDLCNEGALDNETAINQLKVFSRQSKLKFLAILEEVALYVEQSEIEKSYAVYLFQWHFRFTFTEQEIYKAFWNNLGGESEMNENYWSKSRTFATNCLQ